MTIAVTTVWVGERILVRLRAVWPRLPARVPCPIPGIDYRIAAFGGLLPDLIDKPMWWWFRPEQMTDSHAWAHTLLFSGSIVLLGILLSVVRFRWSTAVIVLGIGSLTHPLVDPVMFHTSTWVWPLRGTEFPSSYTPLGPLQESIEQIIVAGILMLSTSPLYRRRFWSFVVTGKVGINEHDSEPAGARSYA